jgi:hypothetical protein
LIVAMLLQLLFDELGGLLPADEMDEMEDMEVEESRLSKEEAQLASAEVVELADEMVDSRCWHL